MIALHRLSCVVVLGALALAGTAPAVADETPPVPEATTAADAPPPAPEEPPATDDPEAPSEGMPGVDEPAPAVDVPVANPLQETEGPTQEASDAEADGPDQVDLAPADGRGPSSGLFADLVPALAAAGELVTLEGDRCPSGTVEMYGVGESTDWYDAPAEYALPDVVADASGAWSTTLTMPDELLAVRADCWIADEYTAFDLVVLGLVDAAPRAATLRPVEGGTIVEGSWTSFVRALTPDGTPVPLTRRESQSGWWDVVVAPEGTTELVLLDYVSFGENAGAESGGTPAQWLATVPQEPAPPPAPGPGAGAGGGLADTGAAAGGTATLAIFLLAGGAGLLVFRRRLAPLDR